MKIEECIDRAGQKFEYDDELIEALKRCVPEMICGKIEEEIALLMETIERVPIYTLNEVPTEKEITAIKNRLLNGRNEHVTIISKDEEEYGKTDAPSSYISEPVFDNDMNIIDRVGFIYLTDFRRNDITSQYYGTRINISDLIHELGHAWAAQKDEYIQEENGNYVFQVGASRNYYIVDRKTHTTKDDKTEGLFVEEAMNTIEQEAALYRLFGIKDYKSIPGYVPTVYQLGMAELMRHCIEKLGETTFEKIRIIKDRGEIERISDIFYQTEFMTEMKSGEYYKNKRGIFESVQNLNLSNKAKNKIAEFFKKYEGLYLKPYEGRDFLGYIDRAMEQIFNFKAIKYNVYLPQYNKEDEQRSQYEVYCQIMSAIVKEGYIPVNQAAELIKERNKQATISEWTVSALNNAQIGIGDINTMQAIEKIGSQQQETQQGS